MKRCRRCGNVYADSRVVCPECGEQLTGPMSEAEIAAECGKTERDAAERKKAENAYHVSKLDRAVGVCCVILAVVSVLMAVLFFMNSNNQPGVVCLGTAAAFALACGMLLNPIKIWEANARRADREADKEKVYPTEGYLRVNKLFAYLLTAAALIVLAARIIGMVMGS